MLPSGVLKFAYFRYKVVTVNKTSIGIVYV